MMGFAPLNPSYELWRTDERWRGKERGQGSTLGQPRLARTINTMLGVLGVLVDEKTFPALNREPGVDPQHLCGFGPRLLKLSQLGISGCQCEMRPLLIGRSQCAFAEHTHRLPIALEHVIGVARLSKPKEERLKRIEADVCLQHLDRSCVLAHTPQGLGVSMVDEIAIERERSFEFGDGGVVLALVKQDVSKLSASLRQAVVESHRRLREFKGAIE